MQGVPIREGVVAKHYLLRMIHVVALTFFSYWCLYNVLARSRLGVKTG
jgi:hypothetical protein